jgi:hypothetical protein
MQRKFRCGKRRRATGRESDGSCCYNVFQKSVLYQGTTSQLAKKNRPGWPRDLDFETRIRAQTGVPTAGAPDTPDVGVAGWQHARCWRDGVGARPLLQTSHEPCQGTTSVVPKEA